MPLIIYNLVNALQMKHKQPNSTPDDRRDDDDDDESNEQEGKKRTIQFKTYKKWQRDFNREMKSLTWLDCITQSHAGKKT